MAKSKAEEFTDEDEGLLGDLGFSYEAPKEVIYTPKQERIIAGFEDIQNFVKEQGRLPEHGEDRDIFERLYAVRLDRIRALDECAELLQPFDTHGLLSTSNSENDVAISDDALLDALGIVGVPDDDITVMKHVRPTAERKSPEEVAQRKPCDDFEQYRPSFEHVQHDLNSGAAKTMLFKHRGDQSIEKDDWFILDGQKAFVAAIGELFMAEHGERDRRLKVVFDNGTQSDMLQKSLRRALNKDEASRRIVLPKTEVGTLFSDAADEEDQAVGTIYVLRSRSDHPFIVQHRELIHKLGVTTGDVKKRVSGAKKDPTYLLADVEIVATFELANLQPRKLEAILQRFFAAARLDVELKDRFGDQVEPREWFLVPLAAIDEAIRRINDGTIANASYDPNTATLVTGTMSSSSGG